MSSDLARAGLIVAAGAAALALAATVAVLTVYAGPAVGECIRDLHAERKAGGDRRGRTAR